MPHQRYKVFDVTPKSIASNTRLESSIAVAILAKVRLLLSRLPVWNSLYSMDLRETLLNILQQSITAALYTAGVTVALFGLRLGYKCVQKSRKLKHVGAVSQLILYPLKSGKGVLVTEAECLRMGLRKGELRDR